MLAPFIGDVDGIVSIHAPARGATTTSGRPTGHPAGFNPRARERRDSSTRGSRRRESRFQSTRPRGARRCRPRRRRAVDSFNPRAREGRDAGERDEPGAGEVSIHAPARGATLFGDGGGLAELVSIHAPARGATRRRRPRKPSWLRFNPRAREGRDVAAPVSEQHEPVSIHAPARGATFATSTVPTLSFSFNPRAREGRDNRDRLQHRFDRQVSIHAPARGATMTREQQ